MAAQEIRPRTSIPSLELPPSSGLGAIPPDLLVEATRRLGVACLVYSGVLGLYLPFNNAIAPVLRRTARWTMRGPGRGTRWRLGSLSVRFCSTATPGEPSATAPRR